MVVVVVVEGSAFRTLLERAPPALVREDAVSDETGDLERPGLLEGLGALDERAARLRSTWYTLAACQCHGVNDRTTHAVPTEGW